MAGETIMALIKLNNRSSEDNAIHGRRNLIINGAMQVAQRGTSETSVSTSGYKTVDRFYHTSGGSATSVWTISQSTDAPSGFGSSLKYECTTAQTSITASQNIIVQHILEGQDLQSIKKGQSEAEQITISFYTKSSKTGTYTVSLYDGDNNRHCSQSYTIDSSDTWERQTVTFPIDTTGAFDNDNAASLYIGFFLVAGDNFKSGTYATVWESYSAANRIDSSQVNLGDAVSNTWQITGVQLEVGDTATPFEHRSYGEEFELCQRYCQIPFAKTVSGRLDTNWQGNPLNLFQTTRAFTKFVLPVTMRTTPSCTIYNPSFDIAWNASSRNLTSQPSNLYPDHKALGLDFDNDGTNFVVGYSGHVDIGAGCYAVLDAEL